MKKLQAASSKCITCSLLTFGLPVSFSIMVLTTCCHLSGENPYCAGNDGNLEDDLDVEWRPVSDGRDTQVCLGEGEYTYELGCVPGGSGAHTRLQVMDEF